MRSYFTARNVTIALSATLLAGLALAEAAHALSGAAFRYTAPQTGYLMIPPAAFTPENDGTSFSNNGGTLDSTGGGCFTAPVNLPQGAKLIQLTMWYSKNDAVPTNLVLKRRSVVDLTTGTIAVIDAAGTGGFPHSAAVAIADPSVQTVNNARYGYYVVQCLSDVQLFFDARIRYTYKTAGD